MGTPSDDGYKANFSLALTAFKNFMETADAFIGGARKKGYSTDEAIALFAVFWQVNAIQKVRMNELP